jgi:hypothetical protein
MQQRRMHQLFDPKRKFAEGTVQDSGQIKQQCRMRNLIKEGRNMQKAKNAVQ